MARQRGAYCLSHVDDIDGICSAALVKAATGAAVKLTDYDDFLDDLRKVPAGTRRLVICDIGFDESTADAVLDVLRRLSVSCVVTYIDHHGLGVELKGRLKAAVAELVWDDRECGSTLAYSMFFGGLSLRAKRLAAYGAVTDYRDQSPIAKAIIEGMSRHTLYLEATLLSNALTEDRGIAMELVDRLSTGARPAQIPGVVELAATQLAKASAHDSFVAKHGASKGGVGWVKVKETDHPAVFSTIVEGVLGTDVGVAYREKSRGWYDVSLRSRSNMKFHMGEVVGEFCAKNGWTGGGHMHAAGCKVPKARMDDLLELLVSATAASRAG